MKLLSIDGYNRENKPEFVIAQIQNEVWAKKIENAMKKMYGCENNWFRLVDNNYEPWAGMRALVEDKDPWSFSHWGIHTP